MADDEHGGDAVVWALSCLLLPLWHRTQRALRQQRQISLPYGIFSGALAGWEQEKDLSPILPMTLLLPHTTSHCLTTSTTTTPRTPPRTARAPACRHCHTTFFYALRHCSMVALSSLPPPQPYHACYLRQAVRALLSFWRVYLMAPPHPSCPLHSLLLCYSLRHSCLPLPRSLYLLSHC